LVGQEWFLSLPQTRGERFQVPVAPKLKTEPETGQTGSSPLGIETWTTGCGSAIWEPELMISELSILLHCTLHVMGRGGQNRLTKNSDSENCEP